AATSSVVNRNASFCLTERHTPSYVSAAITPRRRGTGAVRAAALAGGACVWRSDGYQAVRREPAVRRDLAGTERSLRASRRGRLREHHHGPFFRPVARVRVRGDELGGCRPNGDQPIQRVPDEGPYPEGERGEAARESRGRRWRRGSWRRRSALVVRLH